MKYKSLLYYITHAFNWLMIKITRPQTKIRDLSTYLHKNFFNLDGVPLWKALKRIDKLIADSINTYHQISYKGESLYNISSVWTLRTALNVIKYNIAKESDFMSTAEPATAIKHFKREIFGWDRTLYNKFFNDTSLNDLARKNSDTKDKFYDLLFDFSEYLYDLEKYAITNRKIKNRINEHRINEYLGQNLYAIQDEKILDEAIDAIDIMNELLDKGVSMYDNRVLEKLTLFVLEKAEIDYNKGEFSNIGFDEVARERFLKEENELLRREKRNEQARARRAKLKAEKEAAAKKVSKQKSISKKTSK